jgi:hypothetical protein
MDKIQLVLMIFAFVCFCLAGWNVTAPNYPRLVAIGLAFFAAAFIFGGALKAFG